MANFNIISYIFLISILIKNILTLELQIQRPETEQEYKEIVSAFSDFVSLPIVPPNEKV